MLSFSPGRILAASLVLAAFAVLVSLGVWQLQRKEWKEALIADLDSRAHGEPSALPKRWEAAKDEFRHVFLVGQYLNDKEIKVYGLLDDGSGRTLQGNYLFVPFKYDDGDIVMINRGFVPKGENDIVRIDGPTRVEGILRDPEIRGWFVPENIPEKGQWFTKDSIAMAAFLKLDRTPPFYVEADAIPTAVKLWPKGGTTRTITLRNDHLQYALTWFGLALVLLGVTGYARLRRKPTSFANL